MTRQLLISLPALTAGVISAEWLMANAGWVILIGNTLVLLSVTYAWFSGRIHF